jgi:hypothetical protein
MKGFELVALPGETQDEAATRVDGESRDAEVVAVETYRRILESPPLLAHFASDATIGGFWRLDAAVRQSLFGAPIVTADVLTESERLVEVYEGWV